MQKHIIIANIGNSNLKHPAIPKNTREQIFSFRDITQKLWQDYESEKNYFRIEIIPSLLDYLNLFDVNLLLYGSDNPDKDMIDQDTIFASKIIAQKLREIYPEISVEARVSNVRPVNADALMIFFRKELFKLNVENPNAFYYFCDAGGTPQQKNAIKLNLEYLIPKNRVRILTAERDYEKSSIIKDTPPVEYRRMIDHIQAQSLVEKYNYEGAYALLSEEERSENSHLIVFIKLGAQLFANFYKDALEILKTKEFQQHEYAFNTSNDPIFPLRLLLDIAFSYEELCNYSHALLYYHIFYESCLTWFIKQYLTEVKYSHQLDNLEEQSGWNAFKDALYNRKIFKAVELPIGDAEWRMLSLPVKRELVLSLKNSLGEKVISSTSKNKIDKFSRQRNKMAHEGRHISKADYMKFKEMFEKWRLLFDLSPTKTLFHDLNSVITSQLIK